jgi:hypothetical protein
MVSVAFLCDSQPPLRKGYRPVRRADLDGPQTG